MAGCELDFSALPILSGCPGDNEAFLVGNAVGGLDVNGMPTTGYARRLWGDLKKCAAKAIRFVLLQFTIGQPGSPMTTADDTLELIIPNIIVDSVFVTLGGPELPRNDTNQISYGVDYYTINPLAVTITFDQNAANGQLYIVHYAYIP